MKRDPALVPLSHDHQHGLAATLRLARCAERPQEEAALREEVASFLRYAHRELAAHFEDEEQALLPVLVREELGLREELARLAIEHAEVRAALADLERAVADGDGADALAASAAQVAQRLREHIRWEERELFEAVQERLDAAQLAALDLPTRLPTPPEGTRLLDLRSGATRDGIAAAELNVTPLDLPPHGTRDAWAADRDVALVLLRGDVDVTVDGAAARIAAPATITIPSGATRALQAGARGCLALSVHRARHGVSVHGAQHGGGD